jgi:hypothetical protein
MSRHVARALALLALACTPRPPVTPRTTPAPVVQYRNGLWFDGEVFVPGDRFVRDGFFVPATTATDVVDLRAQHVVPPFAEAHNHNIDPRGSAAKVLDGYLGAGVFYVQNPNNLPGARAALAGQINRPDAVDVAFANGGFTGPDGHPAEIARRNIDRGRWTAADGEGAFYYTVARADDVDRHWAALLATRPDFLKVYLLYSEASGLSAGAAGFGWRGLDPALLLPIVQRAHRVRLRVVAHVETASDFHAAVSAGVDQIGHTPGFRGDQHTRLPDPARFSIRPEDARAAARQGTVVVTTLAGLSKYAGEQGDRELRRAADDLNRSNLATLQAAGVAIAIGSDEYSDNSVGEARYLASLGAFTPAALLRSWCQVTPRAIFPDRRIGKLEPDHEASFLVLAGDPLADFGHTGHIVRAVKQGRQLQSAP